MRDQVSSDIRISLLVLLLMGGQGCLGIPISTEAKPVADPTPDEAVLLMQEQGAWINLATAESTSGLKRGQVMELPAITLIFQGETEMGREQVRLEVGTDSSRLDQMPASGCFPGLVPPELVPLPASGPFEPGCKRPGYEQLRRCPHDSKGRLPIHLAAYTLANHWGKVFERRRLIKASDLASGRATTLPMGRLCDQAREVNSLVVPQEMFAGDGRVRLSARLTLIVDSRGASVDEIPRTFLRGQLVNR